MKAACYVIDLDEKKPEIRFLDQKDLDLDLRFYQAKTINDLSDNDRKYFKTESEAEKFLAKYFKAFEKLKNNNDKVNRKHPSLIYKRRYLILSSMSLKNKTVRSYNKKWKTGQLINLYDQTYFLTVKIKSIKQIDTNLFQYDFELP